MESAPILAFTMVALLLVISPGPNGLLIAKTVPVSGKSAGFANVFGFITAFYLHGVLSILGISVILTKSVEAFFVIKILGALYLMWIGMKALFSVFQKTENISKNIEVKGIKQKTLSKAFVEGFLTNALNPKVSMFYLAAFPQFIPIGESAYFYGFLLITIHASMNCIWFTSMVMLLSKMLNFGKNRTFQQYLNTVTGLFFIGFGVKLLTLKAAE